MQELSRKNKWNCAYVSVFNEFIMDGSIKASEDNFEEGLYLTKAGIRVLRTAWLRHLGFFPKKPIN